MPEPKCFATDFDFGPINWRCNRPAGHDGAHASSQFGVDHHEWENDS